MSSADWEDIWSSKVVGTEDETQGGVSIMGTSLGNVFLRTFAEGLLETLVG